jgi:hypothetical protein
MPLLKELEFTAMIKEYLPADAGPAMEVVNSDVLPDVGVGARAGRFHGSRPQSKLIEMSGHPLVLL